MNHRIPGVFVTDQPFRAKLQEFFSSYTPTWIHVGVHDILYRQGSDSSNGLDTKGISIFAVLSNKKEFDDYTISTHLGLGSGKINEDSHLFTSNPNQNIGVFLGFEFKTPYLKKNGGISFITEFDGKGLNLGSRIPIMRSYQLNLGITNFENFGEFATEDKRGTDFSKLIGSAPSIIIGLSMNIPKIIKTDNNISSLDNGVYAKNDSSILYYDPICKEIVEVLRDSIRVEQNLVENLSDHNKMLLHSESILIDSTRNDLLKLEIMNNKQNKSMRHLSRSLRFFYDEQYRDALSEVNIAIEENPNLAIAYGRRGSIYYKLGDKRRATLNWNVALQLDPEFTEIYEILKASEENRLQPIEISKNIGDIK